jgi:hypothetical protein
MRNAIHTWGHLDTHDQVGATFGRRFSTVARIRSTVASNMSFVESMTIQPSAGRHPSTSVGYNRAATGSRTAVSNVSFVRERFRSLTAARKATEERLAVHRSNGNLLYLRLLVCRSRISAGRSMSALLRHQIGTSPAQRIRPRFRQTRVRVTSHTPRIGRTRKRSATTSVHSFTT